MDNTTLIVIIVLTIIIVILFSLTIYFGVENSKSNYVPPPTIQNQLYTQPYGSYSYGAQLIGKNPESGRLLGDSMENCVGENKIMDDNCQCQCILPYYGDFCDFQYYSNTYFSLGTVSDTNLSYTIEKTIENINMSFDENMDPIIDSCTGICDGLNNCTGVLFEPSTKTCSILSGDIHVTGETYTNGSNGIYIRGNKTHPMFDQKVFLFTGSKPINYWNLKNVNKTNITPGFFTATLDVVNELNWLPETVINDNSKLVGLWSLYKFTPQDFDGLVKKIQSGNNTGENSANMFIDDNGGINAQYSLLKKNSNSYKVFSKNKMYFMYKIM